MVWFRVASSMAFTWFAVWALLSESPAFLRRSVRPSNSDLTLRLAIPCAMAYRTGTAASTTSPPPNLPQSIASISGPMNPSTTEANIGRPRCCFVVPASERFD